MVFSAASALSRFASVKNTTPAGTPSSGGSSGGAIGKKSMSTTNLVDERQKTSGPSVASTGQAASAESLQHQTPSLENLLARAMPHAFGRIAENQEPEDEPMGGEESDSAASMRSAASSNSQMSMGSSSQQQQQQDSDMTPRDSAGTPSTPRDDKNQTLSVSAPDLAAARQRQASAETDGDADADETNSEDKTVGADDAMEEDDEEEETMEDEEDDDDDDDDESSNENQEKLVELLGGERGLFDKLKEVITGESLSDASSSAKDATTNEAQKKGGKKPKKWFKKMSSYTDVLKGMSSIFFNFFSSNNYSLRFVI